MTTEALDRVLAQVAELLRQNKKYMTTDMLLRVMQLWDKVRGLKDIVAAGLQLSGEQADRLFEMGDKLLAYEQKLVTTSQTDDFVQALEGLRNRPVILRMLAALLK